MTDTQSHETPGGRRMQIDTHDADGRPAAGPVRSFEISDETAVLVRETQHPGRDPARIECERDGKEINQHCYVETAGRSRSGSASSLNHHDRLLILVRDGNSWTAYNPNARPSPRSDTSDYQPTQVPGVSLKTVSSRRGGRGHESSYHRRYMIQRQVLEGFNEAWLIEYRHEIGGSRNGEYNRVKNATATELKLAD